MVKTKHIKNLTFAYNTPILYLDKDEELSCKLSLGKGCGRDHAKWFPVNNIRFTHHDDDSFIFTLGLNGSLTLDQILNDCINQS